MMAKSFHSGNCQKLQYFSAGQRIKGKEKIQWQLDYKTLFINRIEVSREYRCVPVWGRRNARKRKQINLRRQEGSFQLQVWSV